jgi:UDP-sulfoquinovose synthase
MPRGPDYVPDPACTRTVAKQSKEHMHILILGGDGFCGWPTALHLSDQGHEVTIVDNLSRRDIDNELSVESLTPISTISTRLKAWKEITNHEIGFANIDISKQYPELLALLREKKPDAVVHFAEQRAAPYSMKSSWHKRYTVDNNISATNNLCAAVVESGLDIHIVHLGTMGVYGYSSVGLPIPEGYLPVKLDVPNKGLVDQDILYPTNPGSIYHMTKSLDQIIFAYYAKNDHLRVTDLHQGIVWGTQTDQTKRDIRLINRFDYDGDYGTVLNRFLMQAAVGYPLTVHGTGGQTRAFIHIRDTVRCVELAATNPPKKGSKVHIMNQVTETHRVRDLAKIVADMTGATIKPMENPRKEDPENDLIVKNDNFLKLGLNPTKLAAGLLEEVRDVAEKYKDRCDLSRIPCESLWVKKA